jgi:hypothetical protein
MQKVDVSLCVYDCMLLAVFDLILGQKEVKNSMFLAYFDVMELICVASVCG